MIEQIPNEWRFRDSETKMPYPWYVKPVIEILDRMDLKRKQIFEFGSGDSAHWYRSRGAFVSGVDSNLTWADKAKVKFEPYYPGYVDYIDDNFDDEYFDIIIIDGIYRDYCIDNAIKAIKKDGFIIIDNFEQPSADLPDWPNTRKLIQDKNLKLEIYKQEGHQDWQTAIIYP